MTAVTHVKVCRLEYQFRLLPSREKSGPPAYKRFQDDSTKESAYMDEPAAVVVEASTEYVGRWNLLISTTNWEKGRIIAEWRTALQQADAPAASYTDDAWSQQVGGVTPQHVGRLRRVCERFGDVYEQYPGLYWSHFQAALDWPDAEMYLEGAVRNDWSVAQMRNQRWEAMGGEPELQPREADIVACELDEDVSVRNDGPLPATISESMGEVRGADDFSEYDDAESASFDGDASSVSGTASDAPSAPLLRPFESLPPLPADLKEAFELMKLAILAHKVCGWSEIARDDVLSVLESLKQLALAPAE
jgi:hypothetical protein